jgi:hypothetical protein
VTETLDLATVLGVVGALLLLASGIAKLVRPYPAVASMRAVGWPSSVGLVRLGGFAEIGTGLAVLAVPGWLPKALMAVAYALFAVFCVASLTKGVASGCGCFGSARTSVSPRHLALNVVIAAAAATLFARSTTLVHAIDLGTVVGGIVLAVCAVTSLLVVTTVSRQVERG